jgi:FtsP/CotA-like multicopper oxidase with cupredoxin domain
LIGTALALLASVLGGHAQHLVDGISGNSFELTAKDGRISTPDGGSIYFWGYADTSSGGLGVAQYPGPTLIVQQGTRVTITLKNTLPSPVSIVFPGQSGVIASGGQKGLLTQEALTDSPVTYTFIASQPGTYTYYSGTQPDLQIELGLVGALIVRPANFNVASPATRKAYNDGPNPLNHDTVKPGRDQLPDSAFDQEYLFLLTDLDPTYHEAVEDQIEAYRQANAGNATPPAFKPNVDTTKRLPVYWFINGRAAPDTMAAPRTKTLPNQPYDAFPRMYPGQNLLMRVIGAGRDPHPFHNHGNHARVIARNGRLLQSSPAAGADLSYLVFTVPSYPGETTDAVFTWTGAGLGWDMYGHGPSDALAPYEDPADHGKPFPVVLPSDKDATYGDWYGGSPFLGVKASLPPGLGILDPSGGYIYMWHSHAEKEIVNNNAFPGGMLTMLLIEPWP